MFITQPDWTHFALITPFSPWMMLSGLDRCFSEYLWLLKQIRKGLIQTQCDIHFHHCLKSKGKDTHMHTHSLTQQSRLPSAIYLEWSITSQKSKSMITQKNIIRLVRQKERSAPADNFEAGDSNICTCLYPTNIILLYIIHETFGSVSYSRSQG